mmetsp:Transcript_35953/g.85708  ORF Transcript_35953/g.85708 Transcript_35953/m.85708 type:complete len:371 (+) Transcript_35953:69-1181(+)
MVEMRTELVLEARRRRPFHVDDTTSTKNSEGRNSESDTGDARQLIRQRVPTTGSSGSSSSLLPWVGLLVWPLMLALPLALNSSALHYTSVFPRGWYDTGNSIGNESGGARWEWGSANLAGGKPLRHPLGLILGISAVVVGHAFLLCYFFLHRRRCLGDTMPIQSRGAVPYVFSEALAGHLAQPGGFLLLGLYLTITWVFDLLPDAYYEFEGNIRYTQVFACLVVQDLVQHVMHRVEHVAHPKVYKVSHKPHHKFTNPKLFDAFDGSVPDTAIMILLPLFVTAHVVRGCNVWTYMAFGSTYANWLTLIHSEVTFPWERLFRRIGLGTAADHHIHHKFFKYNFGHLFMWFDWLVGTYRDPQFVWGKEFNVGV